MASLQLRATRLSHPLLTQVAHQACRSAPAGAAAVTRHATGAGHELLAAAGDAELLDDLAVPARDAFRDAEPVVSRHAASALLPLDDETWGALTLLRPRVRRGAALRDCLGDLAALATEALRAAEAERRLELTLEAAVGSLAALLDLRDGYTGQHSSTVVDLCEQVARRVGVTGEELQHLRVAAHLHDLGKIGVPDQILHKPGPLDETEWSIMREHPVWGARALESIPGFHPASRAVRHHHERWDGTGYPDGLAGEAIPIGARVIAVCDAYEAMTATRPYRPALAEPLARERIVAGTGSQFDPAATWGLLDALAC
jgi:HD-GYP domain-containing protein (c-di-GMP phosphodiesterase class II)